MNEAEAVRQVLIYLHETGALYKEKTTKKIKLNAWLVDGVLQWHREDKMVVGANHSKRIPSEDKWVEVEE